MKIGIGFIFVVSFLFLGSAFAADPVQPAEPESCVQFTFDTGPIIMTRHQSDKAIFSSEGHAGSGDILKSSNVDDEWRMGGQARAAVTFPCFYVDFGGFWIPSDSDTAHNLEPEGDNIIETSPRTSFGNSTSIIGTFKYSSSIYNLAGNIGHSFTPWFSAYAGVRYMRLKEELNLFSPFGGGESETDNWKTKNSLVGPQIGARADILKVMGVCESSPWSLDTNVAFALLHNHGTSHYKSFYTPAIPSWAPFGSASSNFWTPGVAAEADLGYRLTRNLKLAVGYQMLYLDRVALATDAVTGTASFNPGVRTNMSVEKDSVLYHGGIVRFVVDLP
jgi:hypothetical protein